MTLLFTCHLVSKNGKNILQRVCRVSRRAGTTGGTSARLKSGDRLKLQDLLYGKNFSLFLGMMLPSGNDAAQTIAENLGLFLLEKMKNKSSDRYIKHQSRIATLNLSSLFLEEMTKFGARVVNIKNSNYANPHGLMNPANLTTAFDVAQVMNFGLERFDLFKKVMSTKYSLTSQNLQLQDKTGWKFGTIHLEKYSFSTRE